MARWLLWECGVGYVLARWELSELMKRQIELML